MPQAVSLGVLRYHVTGQRFLTWWGVSFEPSVGIGLVRSQDDGTGW